MSDQSHEIVRHLPGLRRYARCLTGRQDRGDRLVEATLEAMLAEPALVERTSNVRTSLHYVFHQIWGRVIAPLEPNAQGGDTGGDRLERHLRALPVNEREALLLTTICEFTPDEAGEILGRQRTETEALLASARRSLAAQTRSSVLIIEDEPVIAFDLAGIVTDMGHSVVGIADTADRAVEMARARRPGIVLADIQLRGKGSGIDAVREILTGMDVPVIFVTAFPERLLTGEGEEPTYLITKPFDPGELEVTISQALLLHPATPLPAVG